MSNERRHELEKNDLAILLDRVSKGFEPYSKMIILGLGAMFIGFIGWLVYSSQLSGERSDSTLELIQGVASQDAEVLREVSDRFPNTSAGAWAKVYQGQLQLSQGIQTLYRDREEAKQLLGDAKLALESAISSSKDPLLRSRAQIGIARAEESLGNFDAAIEAYKQVVSIGESEAIIEQAEERIAALGDPKTKEFLVWFDDQNFTPADPSLPPSLPGLDTLPDLPDFSLRELPGGEAKDELDLEAEVDVTESETPEDGNAESESPEAKSPEENSPEEKTTDAGSTEADSTEATSAETEGDE